MIAHIEPFVPSPQFAPAQKSEPLDLRPFLLSADKLLAEDLPQRPKLLGEWMRKGDLGYLFAPRGAGKSWMAMMIGKAVATGSDLGEWKPGDGPAPVYYFDAEMNLPDLQERARKLGIDSQQFHWLSNERLFEKNNEGINIANPAHQDALGTMLDDGSLFIIDNLSTSQLGMAENDNDAFDRIRDWLLRLRGRGITVLIVHHAGRNGAMRGASRREDMAHWIISLKEADEEGGTQKAFVTSFGPPAGKCRNCQLSDAATLRWTMEDSESGFRIGCSKHSGMDALLALIQDGISSASQLADLLGVPKGTICKRAKKLQQAGSIENRRGQYYPVEDPF